MTTQAIQAGSHPRFCRRAEEISRARLRPHRSDHSLPATHPVLPDTLAPYLTWDKQHYTRNLIDKTPLYELVAICWEIGQASSVHNHREQNCWMAVPIGRLRVENFRVVAQNLDKARANWTPQTPSK